MRRPKRDVRVEHVRLANRVSAALVSRAITTVLDGESLGDAEICVTFLSSQRMRVLNRNSFGRDRATDVIAFGLPHPGLVVGDIYVCPSMARRSARSLRLSEREELLRVIVHGTLHALGFEHPKGDERLRSDMWRKQEGYLGIILRGKE